MIFFTRLAPGSGYAIHVLPGLIIIGLGRGCFFAPAFGTATLGVPRTEAGIAAAMVNTSQQVGGSVGTALLSTLFASAAASYAGSHAHGPGLAAAAMVHGYTTAFCWAGGTSAWACSSRCSSCRGTSAPPLRWGNPLWPPSNARAPVHHDVDPGGGWSSIILNFVAALWGCGVVMFLRTEQAGGLIQMLVIILLSRRAAPQRPPGRSHPAPSARARAEVLPRRCPALSVQQLQ